MRRLIGGILVIALLLSGPSVAAQESLVVFLVRHAEKENSSTDPQLSAAGAARAAALAVILRDSGIRHVHTSNFIRTRTTAAPVAAMLGLEPDLYDHANLPALVEKIRKTGGRHLIVGHSNTTPEAVRLLGGDAGSPIDEAGEYDRLYVVTIGSDGAASTVLIRFGSHGAGGGE